MAPVCGTASEGVLYGWGKNAPAVAMPQGSGFSVGPGTGIRSLVLQASRAAAGHGHLAFRGPCWRKLAAVRLACRVVWLPAGCAGLTAPLPYLPMMPLPTDALLARPPRQRHQRHQAAAELRAGALLGWHGCLCIHVQGKLLRCLSKLQGVQLTACWPLPAPCSSLLNLREPLPPALQIMPRTNSTLVKNSCCYAGWEPLHGFATRVHTHTMGRWAQPAAELRSTASSRRAQGQALRWSSCNSHAAVLHAIPNFWGPALSCGCREVYLDRARPTGRSALERVVSLSPQKPQVRAAPTCALAWHRAGSSAALSPYHTSRHLTVLVCTFCSPQGFYPVQPEATFLPGDQLTMACDFDSTNVVRPGGYVWLSSSCDFGSCCAVFQGLESHHRGLGCNAAETCEMRWSATAPPTPKRRQNCS